MSPEQMLHRLGWDQGQIEGLHIRCMKEGQPFVLEALKIHRQAIRDGDFPDPLTRFLRELTRPFWRLLFRLNSTLK